MNSPLQKLKNDDLKLVKSNGKQLPGRNHYIIRTIPFIFLFHDGG